jgi:hypothetical protein
MVKEKENTEAPFPEFTAGKQRARRFAEGPRSGEKMGAFGSARVMVLAVVATVAFGCKYCKCRAASVYERRGWRASESC